MIQVICYFFPALLSLRYDKEIGGSKSKNLLDIVTRYALYVIIINGLIYTLLYLFTVHRYRYFSPSHFNVSFALQYMILAGALSWIVPHALSLVKKYISVDIKAKRK